MDAEIAANALAFRSGLAAKLHDNLNAVGSANAEKIDAAYGRLTTLQAWRSSVLEGDLPASCMGFFSEAQNDGLTSIVLVSSGLWRPSLKSLRSIIENVLHCFYYMDHPVEYRQWEVGTNRPTFQKLFEYFENHPDILKLDPKINSVKDLKGHYSHLSNAVHASAKSLRMTDDLNQSNLWKTGVPDVGQWASTQKNVLRDVNLLLLPLMKAKLQGAAHKSLRQAIGLAIPTTKDGLIRSELGIRIIRS